MFSIEKRHCSEYVGCWFQTWKLSSLGAGQCRCSAPGWSEAAGGEASVPGRKGEESSPEGQQEACRGAHCGGLLQGPTPFLPVPRQRRVSGPLPQGHPACHLRGRDPFLLSRGAAGAKDHFGECWGPLDQRGFKDGVLTREEPLLRAPSPSS